MAIDVQLAESEAVDPPAAGTGAAAPGPSGDASDASDAADAATIDMLGATEADHGATPTAPAPGHGTAIDRYLVLALLGRGGMGVVMSAYDPELDRRVAVKLIARRGAATTEASAGQLRLVREAQAMARLSHPNVVPVFDAGTHAGDVFVAMELCEGGTLGQWCRAQPRSWRAIVDAFVEAGRGLAAAHAAGMIHRDFKPDNVMVGADGAIKVTDFGLVAVGNVPAVTNPTPSPSLSQSARAITESLTRTGHVVGTPRYMAPEQFGGDPIDARSDQFSLCAALFEALWPTRVPRNATFAALVAADELGAVTDDDPVPAPVRAAIERGLALRPDDRFPTVTALLAALHPPAPPRRRWPIAVAIAMVAIAGAAVALTARGSHAPASCALPATDLDGRWTPSARAALRSSFVATGLSYAATSADEVVTGIDGYLAAWADGTRAACRDARALGKRDSEPVRRRMACLGRRRLAAEALLAELTAHPDAAAVIAAPDAVTRLPSVLACADVESAPPSRVPTALATEVERALATIDAQLGAGHYRAAALSLPAVAQRAERLGDPELWARAVALRAEVNAASGSLIEARRDYGTALALARRDSLLELEASIWHQLANGERMGTDPEDTLVAARMAATLAHLRDDRYVEFDSTLTQIRIESQLGMITEAEARMAAVLPDVTRAKATHWRLDAHHAMVSAELAEARGDFAAALADLRRAHATFASHLGADHPELAYIENSLAVDLFELDQFDETRRWLERCRARLRATELNDGVAGSIAVNSAMLALQLGDDATDDLAEAEAQIAKTPNAVAAVMLDDLRGQAAFARGDLATARTAFEWAASRAHGRNSRAESRALDNLARALTMSGELVAAEAAARRAIAVRGREPNPAAVALTRGTLARILSGQGRHADADVEFRAALAALGATGYRAGEVAELTVAHAINLESMGRLDLAAPIGASAVTALRAANRPYYLAMALEFDAEARWRAGDPTAARAAAHEARRILLASPEDRDDVREVDAWLRAHPGRD